MRRHLSSGADAGRLQCSVRAFLSPAARHDRRRDPIAHVVAVAPNPDGRGRIIGATVADGMAVTQ